MHFFPNQVFHVYNQGNNRQPIFYTEANYVYFLRKMDKYLLPYADILSYCLMPNHFHWLLYVRPEGCFPGTAVKPKDKYHQGSRATKPDFQPNMDLREKTWDIKAGVEILAEERQQALCQSIGALLSSYSRAILKQQKWTGSLFRQKTKAKDGWIDEWIVIDEKKEPLLFRPDNDYAFRCFKYIHNNPVKAGLVSYPKDWPYSSYRDFLDPDRESVCNRELAKKVLKINDLDILL